MPDPALPASLAVLFLGLTASLSWGVSDFAGGWLARRAPLLGVALATQLVGLVLAIGAAAARGEPALGPGDVGWAVLAGLLVSVGLVALYGGLAVGRMGIVAPVTGLLVASIPVIAGTALQGMPPPVTLLGIGLAIVAVVVVSLSPGEASDGPSGLRHALVAGFTLGLLTVVMSRFEAGRVFAPLVVVRLVEAVVFVGFIAVRRPRWQVGRGLWPVAIGIGAVDLLGNGAYVAATQTGALAIAAVLSSLYPVVTVLLATILLGERVGRLHAAGIVLAGVAIVLIAGSTRG